MSILTVKIAKGMWLSAMIMLCVMASTISYGHAQTITGLEYQVKAGFIYNFAKFVGWPEEAAHNNKESLIIGIIPDNSQSDVFYTLTGKRIGGRKIEVKKFDSMKDTGVELCRVLFFDSKDKKFIQKSLSRIQHRSVLTVGHMKGFTHEGGIINFFNEKGKLRFEVNLDEAKRSGLRLGSQLLMSAEIVQEELR